MMNWKKNTTDSWSYDMVRGVFKKRGTRRSIPTEYNGILFDSKTEAEYYKHLLKNDFILDIELQPEYQIIKAYKVVCGRCKGSGKFLNVRTSNLNNCRSCAGKGAKTKAGAIYTADFKILFRDGSYEIVDVKGGPVGRDFSLRRKLLESKSGQEVVVIRLKGKEWVRE
jgi:hypothetical protein